MHTYSLYEFVELEAILAKSQEQLRSITRVIKHVYSLLSHPKDNTGGIQTLLQDGPSSPEGIPDSVASDGGSSQFHPLA